MKRQTGVEVKFQVERKGRREEYRDRFGMKGKRRPVIYIQTGVEGVQKYEPEGK